MRLFIKCNTVLGAQIIYIIEDRFPSRHKLRFCHFADTVCFTVSVSYTTIKAPAICLCLDGDLPSKK